MTLPTFTFPRSGREALPAIAGLLAVVAGLGAVAAEPVPAPDLLPVPDVRQSTNYSCGASALQAVLAYYGIEVREDELMRRLGSTPEQGTPPDAIVRVARENGLDAEVRQQVTFSDLSADLAARRPVIVDAQAWREGEELKLPWARVWESGHYMVAIGLDPENLYVEDPSLLGSRGVIPRAEFEQRWHDYENGPGGTRVEYLRAAIFLRGRQPAPPAGLTPVE